LSRLMRVADLSRRLAARYSESRPLELLLLVRVRSSSRLFFVLRPLAINCYVSACRAN